MEIREIMSQQVARTRPLKKRTDPLFPVNAPIGGL